MENSPMEFKKESDETDDGGRSNAESKNLEKTATDADVHDKNHPPETKRADQINECKEKIRQEFTFESLIEKYGPSGYKQARENGVVDCDYEKYLYVAKERYEILIDTISFSTYLYDKYRYHEEHKNSPYADDWSDLKVLLSLFGGRKENRVSMLEKIFFLGHVKKGTDIYRENYHHYICENPLSFPRRFYDELDGLFSQKPDVVIAVPKSGIPLSIVLKQICKTAQSLNPEFSKFSPEFKVPPFKIKVMKHKIEKQGDNEHKEEIEKGKTYFKNLVLKMYNLGKNKITLCDDVVWTGAEYYSAKYLIDEAVKSLKKERVIDDEYEISVGIVTVGSDSFLNKGIFMGFIDDNNHGEKGGSKLEHWVSRKVLRFIGRQLAKDYFSLQTIRRTPDRVDRFGFTRSNTF